MSPGTLWTNKNKNGKAVSEPNTEDSGDENTNEAVKNLTQYSPILNADFQEENSARIFVLIF